MAAVAAEPDNAFTVEDLCDHVYEGMNRIEKKHRVAVIRAMRNAARRADDLEIMTGSGMGRPLILFSRYSVPSYAMAELKADNWNYYRVKDERAGWCSEKMRSLSPVEQEALLRAKLDPGGDLHQRVAEGGACWREVRLQEARRDGDKKLIRAIEVEAAKRMAALLTKLRRR